MVSWLRQMRTNFGFPFLWLIVLIYFIQGFRSFVWMAVSFELKDMLKLSPSTSQLLVSIAHSPWSIKPLYGILSDCIPIRGRKRLPYLIFATLLSLVPWLILGLSAPFRSSSASLTIFLTIQNIGSAMADVVVDAMIAEAVRFERVAYAGDLQLISWSAMALGGICGNLLGGYSSTSLKIHTIFIIFSMLPSIQLLSCAFVKEASFSSNGLVDENTADALVVDSFNPEKTKKNVSMEYAPNKDSLMNDNGCTNVQNGKLHGALEELDAGLVQTEKHSTVNAPVVETDDSGSMRRRKKTIEVDDSTNISMHSAILKLHEPVSVKWLLSLRSGVYSLAQAFRQPIILRPMTWFFIAHVTVPNISISMFYYQTESLHLDSSFVGTTRVVGWCGLMLGSFIYSRFLKHIRLRRILTWAQVGLAFLILFDIALVSRLNVLVGMSDKAMVLGGSALADAVHQLKLMPFLIISGRLCPPGIEGTLFALFMSINNLGSTLSSFLGAGLASALHIQSEAFDNLLLANVVRLICSFIPIAFLFLIPEEATGVSS